MKLSIKLVLFGISQVFGSSELLEETETDTSCLPPFEFADEFENVFKTGFCAIQSEILGKKDNLTDCEKCHMAKATIEDQSFEFEMTSHLSTLIKDFCDTFNGTSNQELDECYICNKIIKT